MRQLITRLDDELHARLRRRAASEGRSMNALVVDLLERELGEPQAEFSLREQLEALGLTPHIPPPEGPVPSDEEVMEMLRGDAGRAVLEALEEGRHNRV